MVVHCWTVLSTTAGLEVNSLWGRRRAVHGKRGEVESVVWRGLEGLECGGGFPCCD